MNLILLPQRFRVAVVVLLALGVAGPSSGADPAGQRKVDPRVPRYFVTKEREARALDFAYRQSIALNPYDVEKVKRYVSLLRDQERFEEARRMLKTGRAIHPRSTRLEALAEELNQERILPRMNTDEHR